jgi:hypothetical protein
MKIVSMMVLISRQRSVRRRMRKLCAATAIWRSPRLGVDLQKCGEPFFAETFCKPFITGSAADDVPRWVAPCDLVDEWSYNPGSGQFITILRFEAGRMTFIRFGDRVR